MQIEVHSCTLFEIFIFCPKIQLWFPEKIVDFFGWKTRENVLVLDFLAVDNFDFTRKIVKKIWMKNTWKCWGFVKIEFLDKNLTFRIVWKWKKQHFLGESNTVSPDPPASLQGKFIQGVNSITSRARQGTHRYAYSPTILYQKL